MGAILMFDIHEFIATHAVNDQAPSRYNCPVCGGRNTFTIAKVNGTLMWNCYRNSCDTKGRQQVIMSLPEIMRGVEQHPLHNDDLFQEIHHNSKFKIPKHFVNVPNAMWDKIDVRTKRYNLHLRDYWHKQDDEVLIHLDLMYDPILDRVVILSWCHGVLTGAYGFSLDPKVTPKWYTYNKTIDFPFIYENGDGNHFEVVPCEDVGIVVEDIFSAIKACETYTYAEFSGIALMGTNLIHAAIPSLFEDYRQLIIMLDADASQKALEIQHVLRVYTDDVKIHLLHTDIKDMNYSVIESIIENYL
jgi:hypothetical protein|tara:strand:+ start:2686 stop:3591 length:906 start_codon:yes stop_codon:yes gene_type:complete